MPKFLLANCNRRFLVVLLFFTFRGYRAIFLVVQSVYTVVTFNPSHPLKILRWCSTHALTTNKEYLNFLNSPNLFLGKPLDNVHIIAN